MAVEGWRSIHEAVIIALVGLLIGSVAAVALYYFML
jgi:ABC-type antimicrobial peptide transport system permease subunit